MYFSLLTFAVDDVARIVPSVEGGRGALHNIVPILHRLGFALRFVISVASADVRPLRLRFWYTGGESMIESSFYCPRICSL